MTTTVIGDFELRTERSPHGMGTCAPNKGKHMTTKVIVSVDINWSKDATRGSWPYN